MLAEPETIPDHIDNNIEVTEIHCHECGGYVKFAVDKSKNGNHVFNCPKCQHEHCRVVENGKITSDRWESRNSAPTYTYTMTMQSWSSTGYETSGGTGGTNDPYLTSAWMNGQDMQDNGAYNSYWKRLIQTSSSITQVMGGS